MTLSALHPWNLTPTEAVAVQRRLAERVVTRPLDVLPELVAGCDVGYDPQTDRMVAAVVVLRRPGMELVAEAHAICPVTFPYVPGLLSFREAPAVLDAFERLPVRPDALIVDGQGLAHPRRCGIACHLGLLLDLPTIGCAKSLLVGEHREPGCRRGCRTQLRHHGEVVGTVLRTRQSVRPVYVSIGHRVDLPSAVRLVLAATRGFRLPEPTRLAHISAGRVSRDR